MANKRNILTIGDSHLWYLVGLITADGSLSKDGRHIDITSKDYRHLKILKDTIGLNNKITIKNREKINEAYRIQFSNVTLYNFLLSIGLMPNKSLILGSLYINDKYFCDFLRGLIDGDGYIRKWIHPSNGREQWTLKLFSGAKNFINWLQDKIRAILKVSGSIHCEDKKAPRQFYYTLKYGKMAAKVILKYCYYGDILRMERKEKLARECLASTVYWGSSNTVNIRS